MSIEQQIAQHAVELTRMDEEAERRDSIRDNLVEKYTRIFRFHIAIRDLNSIADIFDEHHCSFHAWIAEQMIDIYNSHAHDVYEKLILGVSRHDAGDLAHKMAAVLDYSQEIDREMNCDPTEF